MNSDGNKDNKISDDGVSGDNVGKSWGGLRSWPTNDFFLNIVVIAGFVVMLGFIFGAIFSQAKVDGAIYLGKRDAKSAYSIYSDIKKDAAFTESGDFRGIDSAYVFKNNIWLPADVRNNNIALKSVWGATDLDVFGASDLPYAGAYSEGGPAPYLHIKYGLNKNTDIYDYARDDYCFALASRLDGFDAVYVAGQTVKNVLDDDIGNDRIAIDDLRQICDLAGSDDYSITAVMAAKPVAKSEKSSQ